jgi:Domain of unknown function (DUF4410)
MPGWNGDLRRRLLCPAMLAALAMALGACAQSVVRPSMRIAGAKLPRPSRILIYAVLTDQAKVTEYNGILSQQPVNPSPAERRRLLRESASAAFETGLTNGLKSLGFNVAPVSRESPIGADELLIESRCLAIDQGDPLRRLIIGFAAGASRFESIVNAYQGPDQRKLLEFTTLADSGKLPGVAVTLPAGALVQGGVSMALVASNAVSSGFSAYQTEVAQLALASAEEAVRYLSEYFAARGWVQAHQVRKARIAYRPW